MFLVSGSVESLHALWSQQELCQLAGIKRVRAIPRFPALRRQPIAHNAGARCAAVVPL
jgi:hypothetical protein